MGDLNQKIVVVLMEPITFRFFHTYDVSSMSLLNICQGKFHYFSDYLTFLQFTIKTILFILVFYLHLVCLGK
jgi:hypothetical protein